MAPVAYDSAEKRAEIVAAAARLFEERGLQRTALADVAERAQVRPGNMYYYFRSKDALVEAVLDLHEATLQTQFDAWTEEHLEPRARLRAFVRAPLRDPVRLLAHGCPHGSLCQDLERLEDDAPLRTSAQRLMVLHLDWVERQFVLAGVPKKDARSRAVDLVASMQGISLLAGALRSKETLVREIAVLEKRLHESFPDGGAGT